jgi:UDP-N-acetylmuramoylalanine--D-glutamate ligase
MSAVPDFEGKRVTVIGLGIEGEDLAHYFHRHGASVTVSALTALPERVAAMEALGVKVSLGANDPADTISADLVCASQGVPLTIPAIVAARESGVPITSMTKLFFDKWTGPICGITGSSGKTTTTSLVDAFFTAAGRDHVLGGNIGIGLTSLLDSGYSRPTPGRGSPVTRSRGFPASADDGDQEWAVLEISHTQLTLTDRSPRVAALLNVTPNHLDQFSWDEYVALKTKIFAFQSPDDSIVLNADDPVSRKLRRQAAARLFLFSTASDPRCDGAFVSDDIVFWRCDRATQPVVRLDEIPLRGAHNVANVAAAIAIAAACGIEATACRNAVLAFRAPSHRIELVATIDGVAYYDDSIATTPERTLAALRSFAEPVVLLLGGRDKKLPLEDLAAEVRHRCRAVLCFGEAGHLFAAALSGAGVPVETVPDLPAALGTAQSRAKAGDVVLLSPAGTSFDAYPNFERRGDHFRALVQSLTPGAPR